MRRLDWLGTWGLEERYVWVRLTYFFELGKVGIQAVSEL
jgi:hypothetical protein